MSDAAPDHTEEVRRLDAQLRELEAAGQRNSAEFEELSAERNRLLNEEDDAV